MRALFALLLLARFDDGPIDEPSDCQPLVEVVESMGKASVDVMPVPPEAFDPLLALHNRFPPPSTDVFSSVAMATMPDHSGMLLWMRRGEVCVRDHLSPAMWQRLLPLIQGTST